MEIVTGAMGDLLPKLAEMLKEEYDLQKGMKGKVRSVRRELESMQAALLKVEKVPRDQLDEQTKLWSGEVRELSYALEDIIDTFLVRGEIAESSKGSRSNWMEEMLGQMTVMFNKVKYQHRLGQAIDEIRDQLQEVAARRDRNTVDISFLKQPVPVDPRLKSFYNEASSLVGIQGKKDRDLLNLLLDGDNETLSSKLKMVSVAGGGGLEKTTLVHVIYDMLKDDFSCKAFVTVGQHPDIKKVLQAIWKAVTSESLGGMDCDTWELLGKLKLFLENVRYLIVVDDVWDKDMWEYISVIFSRNNNQGSRLISTTRNLDVAEACCSSSHDVIYRMQPLTAVESEVLFYRRVFSEGSGCPAELKAISEGILQKCGGVPLAILTMTSLLASGVLCLVL